MGTTRLGKALVRSCAVVLIAALGVGVPASTASAAAPDRVAKFSDRWCC